MGRRREVFRVLGRGVGFGFPLSFFFFLFFFFVKASNRTTDYTLLVMEGGREGGSGPELSGRCRCLEEPGGVLARLAHHGTVGTDVV